MRWPKLGGHLIVFGPKYSMVNDAEFILDNVVEAGYWAVEGGAVDDVGAYRRQLGERGLVCAGLHTSISRRPDIEVLIIYVRTLAVGTYATRVY